MTISNEILVPPPPPQGNLICFPGGSLPLEVVPDARESPSIKHPKRGFNGIVIAAKAEKVALLRF